MVNFGIYIKPTKYTRLAWTSTLVMLSPEVPRCQTVSEVILRSFNHNLPRNFNIALWKSYWNRTCQCVSIPGVKLGRLLCWSRSFPQAGTLPMLHCLCKRRPHTATQMVTTLTIPITIPSMLLSFKFLPCSWQISRPDHISNLKNYQLSDSVTGLGRGLSHCTQPCLAPVLTRLSLRYSTKSCF